MKTQASVHHQPGVTSNHGDSRGGPTKNTHMCDYVLCLAAYEMANQMTTEIPENGPCQHSSVYFNKLARSEHLAAVAVTVCVTVTEPAVSHHMFH